MPGQKTERAGLRQLHWPALDCRKPDIEYFCAGMQAVGGDAQLLGDAAPVLRGATELLWALPLEVQAHIQ
jgi:hypothetical protein